MKERKNGKKSLDLPSPYTLPEISHKLTKPRGELYFFFTFPPFSYWLWAGKYFVYFLVWIKKNIAKMRKIAFYFDKLCKIKIEPKKTLFLIRVKEEF